MTYEKLIKIVQQITFTTFLILCVAVMAYAIFRMYIDSRMDWERLSMFTDQIEQLDNDIERLIERVDRLVPGPKQVLPFGPF